ncbi:MAG: C40 family peptidase [Bacteroidales bacterium]|nr:C40 family peptidase [Bacteroidales bacterium]
MEKYGICHLPLAPLRSHPDDASEMVSQILFGQTLYILDSSNPKWTLIRVRDDGYQAYIGNKQYQTISKEEFEHLNQHRQTVNRHGVCITQTNKQITFEIPLGSILPTEESFRFGNYEYSHNFVPQKETLLETARSFLNAPYLWGGKSIFGIDCSGFTQTVFSAHGIQLLRDASQQATQGQTVPNLSQARPADLAFFDNDKGRIIHVGILLDNSQIIHASGCVRIDRIDEKGIFNKEIEQYTHHLAAIRRF